MKGGQLYSVGFRAKVINAACLQVQGKRVEGSNRGGHAKRQEPPAHRGS